MIVLPYQDNNNIFKINCQLLNLLFSRVLLGRLNAIFIISEWSGILLL